MPCYQVPHSDGVPRYMTGDQGDDFWAQYGGVRVGDQFCRDTGGEPEPLPDPVAAKVEWATTTVGTVLAPVLDVFKGFFAPPPVKGTRTPEQAMATAAATAAREPEPEPEKPCACHGPKTPPGLWLLGLLLMGWLAWKAFKR